MRHAFQRDFCSFRANFLVRLLDHQQVRAAVVDVLLFEKR